MPDAPRNDAETIRLQEDASRHRNWKRWGPYLSERQWGTVREDYSADGNAWAYLPHDHARSRAYRWGEDGLLGLTDRECRLCFALALWNGKDPILKERLFGLANPEGNHGEDVKEEYYYLDSTPTHSYMRALYKYPQAAFPYAWLVEENGRRGVHDREFELKDTGVFNEGRYFDVQAEYAKSSPDDVLVRLTLSNRGPVDHELHVLPTLWYRNTWTWGCSHEGGTAKPQIRATDPGTVVCDHETLGQFRLAFGVGPDGQVPPLLFTENHTHNERLFGVPSATPYVKDAFHRYVVNGEQAAVSPRQVGTKVAGHYRLVVPAGQSVVLRLRLFPDLHPPQEVFGTTFDEVFTRRRTEADAFYQARIGVDLEPAERQVVRQAYAGMFWSKQFYHYVVSDWLDGDPNEPPPPAQRRWGRNRAWRHVYDRGILSMPDKWEYPYFCAWDSAFHAITYAAVDPDFAKQQLKALLREWYMRGDGQIPAYEFAFDDVNPPVHAWACWRVYKMTAPRGKRDKDFLASCFQKLLINFTWWVNRKDPTGQNIFGGGFLGLDNIGAFDRSMPLPGGAQLQQADGTAWMAFYCLTMLAMALELAEDQPGYEDLASKFFEHFVAIADALNHLGGSGLWDHEDGFYYDHLQVDGHSRQLKVRSMVGLIPLYAVEVVSADVMTRLPGFTRRAMWFLKNRTDLAGQISYMQQCAQAERKAFLLAIPSRHRLERVLRYLFDEEEFLSPYGVRALSRVHLDRPYRGRIGDHDVGVTYVPGESQTRMFGGNSNWRGPVWFPVNYLLIEALERYHEFFGEDFKVEFPTGSGNHITLKEAARNLAFRLSRLFIPGHDGQRPVHGDDRRYADDPHYKDLVLFYEYFDGDSGRGCGASHQTGWTGLVTRCLAHMKRPGAFGHGL